MITYKALWDTIKNKGINKQYLVDQLGFSKGMMDNLNHNRPITTTTLNDICNKLDCRPEDVITYKKDKKKPKLFDKMHNNKYFHGLVLDLFI